MLAGLVDGTSTASDVERILQHFHDYGTVVRSLLKGPAFRVIRSELVGGVEARLDRGSKARMRIAPRIAACAIADATLSPIMVWLDGGRLYHGRAVAGAGSRSARPARCLRPQPRAAGVTPMRVRALERRRFTHWVSCTRSHMPDRFMSLHAWLTMLSFAAYIRTCIVAPVGNGTAGSPRRKLQEHEHDDDQERPQHR